MPSALDICRANTASAKAKDEAARAKLRADFPEATAFAKRMAAELAADESFPGCPKFRPRVIAIGEGDKSWSRS